MAIDVGAARVVEFHRLLNPHVRLLREHASLKRKRFDYHPASAMRFPTAYKAMTGDFHALKRLVGASGDW